MERSEKIRSAPEQTDSVADGSVDQAEPPKIYLPACGALCDIFWWARRTPERSE